MVCSGIDGAVYGVLRKAPWSCVLQNYSSRFVMTKEKGTFYMKSKDAVCDMRTPIEPTIWLNV